MASCHGCCALPLRWLGILTVRTCTAERGQGRSAHGRVRGRVGGPVRGPCCKGGRLGHRGRQGAGMGQAWGHGGAASGQKKVPPAGERRGYPARGQISEPKQAQGGSRHSGSGRVLTGCARCTPGSRRHAGPAPTCPAQQAGHSKWAALSPAPPSHGTAADDCRRAGRAEAAPTRLN